MHASDLSRSFSSILILPSQQIIKDRYFREFIYGMFTDYSRLSLAAIANNTHMNYQRLRYFFSESHWNTKELVEKTELKLMMLSA